LAPCVVGCKPRWSTHPCTHTLTSPPHMPPTALPLVTPRAAQADRQPGAGAPLHRQLARAARQHQPRRHDDGRGHGGGSVERGALAQQHRGQHRGHGGQARDGRAADRCARVRVRVGCARVLRGRQRGRGVHRCWRACAAGPLPWKHPTPHPLNTYTHTHTRTHTRTHTHAHTHTHVHAHTPPLQGCWRTRSSTATSRG
jgi:hypothetical protein